LLYSLTFLLINKMIINQSVHDLQK
jgi:hypothetical protein